MTSDSQTLPTNSSERRIMDEEAINNFREYLRIPTVQPNINYDDCIKFLENQAKLLELPFKVYKCAENKPIFLISWMGEEPDLPSIWLNSHMDVVPVFEEKWTYKPFGAHMDDNGNIYGRGAQDDKCIGIQYLEAIRRLRKEGVQLKRTVHVAFVPEEEVGGVEGMRGFVLTEDFRKLNVGFALDEGGTTANDAFNVFYGERFSWAIKVHCPGQQGHGSLLMPHPPGDKLGVIVNSFNKFRARELSRLSDNPQFNLADVTTINLTELVGGVQNNVVPPEFIATFDIRMPATVDTEKFEEQLNKWCKEAGDGVWFEYIYKNPKIPYTMIDESNLYWTAFKKTMDDLKLTINPIVCYAASDSRFIRQLGIPALNFSPMNNTVFKIHDDDEYLNAKTFLNGIDIYTKIIPAISNVP